MLQMCDWRLDPPYLHTIASKNDHLTARLEILTDAGEEWTYKLDMEQDGRRNVIDLTRENGLLYADLTRSMLARSGVYRCQVRGQCGDRVRHSNIFSLLVGDSIDAAEAFPDPLPSEFLQMERRVTVLKAQAERTALRPPRIGPAGTWEVFTGEEYTDTGVLARGETPKIVNGTWWIGSESTGVPASGGSAGAITNLELEQALEGVCYEIS